MSAADLEKAYGIEKAFPDYSRFIDGMKSTDSSEWTDQFWKTIIKLHG